MQQHNMLFLFFIFYFLFFYLFIFIYIYIYQTFLFTARQSPVGQGLLIYQVSRSHSDAPHSVGLIWTSVQPSLRPLPDNTQHSQETDIHALPGFEPAIPTSEWP